MKAEQLRAWRVRRGWNQDQVGNCIGRSRERICLYETGREAIPLIVRLALWAVDQGTADFDGTTRKDMYRG